MQREIKTLEDVKAILNESTANKRAEAFLSLLNVVKAYNKLRNDVIRRTDTSQKKYYLYRRYENEGHLTVGCGCGYGYDYFDVADGLFFVNRADAVDSYEKFGDLWRTYWTDESK